MRKPCEYCPFQTGDPPLWDDEPQIWVTDGLHSGVEPTGGEVVDYLDANPIDGVFTSRTYPEAVRKGVRFRGKGEIGGLFSQDVYHAPPATLDPDERAVQRFQQSLCSLPRHWLGIDPHDSRTRNANSLVVGNRATLRAIGVASIFGLENVLVLSDYPFFEFAQKFVSVETERAPQTNRLSQPAYWRDRLAEIADLGPDGMRNLGLRTYRNLRYFGQLELVRIDAAGNPNPATIRMIEKLEDIPVADEYLAPVELPRSSTLRDLVPPGKQLRVSYWNDKNNSPERPDILGYRKDGRPRRIVFGAFLLELSPDSVVLRDKHLRVLSQDLGV